MLDSSVFKAYDVRGIVPDELDAEGAYRLGRAYVAAFEPATMAIGHDMRLTSPELAEAAARGASEQGADVVALGEIGTEMLYYAVGEHGYEGGIQVTASHNPRAYNGMKIVRRGARPVGGDTGLDKIKRFAEDGTPDGPGQPGTISQRDIYEGFHERVLRLHRSLGDPAAAGRAGRHQRDGRPHDRPADRAPADHRHPPPPRPGRQLSQRRAQPADRGEPPLHRRAGGRERVPTWASPGTATPTGASSSTTPASSCPAT